MKRTRMSRNPMKPKHHLITLDLATQKRAWGTALKKLTPSERARVNEYYYGPYFATAGTGIWSVIAPPTIPFNVALGGGLGAGLRLTTPDKYKKDVEKFRNLYHAELEKERIK